MLYLYFAANMDGYTMALSPTAIQMEIGMPPSTYRDQFNRLLSKGYLIHSHGNTYDFYEVPQPRPAMEEGESRTSSVHEFDNTTAPGHGETAAVPGKAAENIEINNKDNSINKTGINMESSPPAEYENKKVEFVF